MSLLRTLSVGLFAIACLAMPALRARAADPSAKASPKMLDELACQYQDEGLPLPPADAPLMLIPSGSVSHDAKGKSTAQYFIAYRLKAGVGKTKPGVFLVGTETYEPELDAEEAEKFPRLVDSDKPLPPHLLKEWWNGPPFPVNVWLALAIQGHLHGQHGLVKQILERGLARDSHYGGPTTVSSGQGWMDPGMNRSMAESPADGNFSESLAATGWNHWMNAVVQPDTNRAEILGRMEKLLTNHPTFGDASQLAFINSLRLTLKPTNSPSGSVEALIDGLTESSVNGGHPRQSDQPDDPNYSKLQLLGFEAVPALIAHLDDQRLTRSVTVGFDNFPSLPRRVGEMVSDLVEDLAGPELGQDWLSRQLGNPAANEPVRQWWEKARTGGEEEYVCGHVMPVEKKENDVVNAACLRIVAARYPQRLGEIYKRLLKERINLNSNPVVESIADSDRLSRDEKLNLLRQGADHSSLNHREDAIYALFKLDPADANARVITELDQLPPDADKEYWLCPEARITQLVMKTDSPGVWAGFVRATKRAMVGLRIELLNPLDYCFIGETYRKERLASLAAFLDDETIRTIKKHGVDNKYSGPCAAFTFSQISVRDFAAMQIGAILKCPGQPNEKWTRTQWSAYREVVHVALAKEY